jgi:GMC oxidoreductase
VFEGTRATGVRLLGGPVIEAGWVVLCAGTYGSPAILMRSGIGPVGHLRAHGIGVRVNLPGLGANLADHGGVDIDCGYAGPARAAPVLHLLATFRSSAASSGEAPDLLLWLSDPRGDPPVFEIDAGLLKTSSRGRVRRASLTGSPAGTPGNGHGMLPAPAWTGPWTGSPGIPAPGVLPVRFPVSSVLPVRSVRGAVVMVRRRYPSIPRAVCGTASPMSCCTLACAVWRDAYLAWWSVKELFAWWSVDGHDYPAHVHELLR